MDFIFPKNYKYRPKILGFIDYITAIIDLLMGVILYFIIHLFSLSISTQIYFFIILFVPIVLFSIFVSGGENIVLYMIKIIRFIKRRGVYFYTKNNLKIYEKKYPK